MCTNKSTNISKRFFFIFLVLSIFSAKAFSQQKIYVWEKDGSVTGFTISEIDSISFNGPQTFTVELGGSGATVGSYLSISNQAVYVLSELEIPAYANSVEIIFDGTSLKSPDQANNYYVSSNGITTRFGGGNNYSVEVELDGSYEFETSNGLKGTITIDQMSGTGSAVTISVTVEKEN